MEARYALDAARKSASGLELSQTQMEIIEKIVEFYKMQQEYRF